MSAMPEPQQTSNQPQLQIVQPPPPAKPPLRFGPIARDVAIVWGLTFLGGFVAGLTGAKHDAHRLTMVLALSNLFFGTVGFTIAGYLAPRPRWNHLAYVALGTWLTSLINVVFFHVKFTQWMTGGFFVLVIMAVGGGLSYLFKKDTA